MNSSNHTERYYKVILSGEPLSGYDRGEVLSSLASLFHSTPEKLSSLLDGTPTPLKKSYCEHEAHEISDAIRNAGAECSLEAVVVGPEDGETNESELSCDSSKTIDATATGLSEKASDAENDAQRKRAQKENLETNDKQADGQEAQLKEIDDFRSDQARSDHQTAPNEQPSEDAIYWNRVSGFVKKNTSYL